MGLRRLWPTATEKGKSLSFFLACREGKRSGRRMRAPALCPETVLEILRSSLNTCTYAFAAPRSPATCSMTPAPPPSWPKPPRGLGGACFKNIPRQPRIVFVFFAALLHGIKDVNQGIGRPALAFDAADARRPAAGVHFGHGSGSLKILCRSPTGHRSGLPGSVRRMRAGSVTMVFSFCRTTGSGSVSMMVLP